MGGLSVISLNGCIFILMIILEIRAELNLTDNKTDYLKLHQNTSLIFDNGVVRSKSFESIEISIPSSEILFDNITGAANISFNETSSAPSKYNDTKSGNKESKFVSDVAHSIISNNTVASSSPNISSPVEAKFLPKSITYSFSSSSSSANTSGPKDTEARRLIKHTADLNTSKSNKTKNVQSLTKSKAVEETECETLIVFYETLLNPELIHELRILAQETLKPDPNLNDIIMFGIIQSLRQLLPKESEKTATRLLELEAPVTRLLEPEPLRTLDEIEQIQLNDFINKLESKEFELARVRRTRQIPKGAIEDRRYLDTRRHHEATTPVPQVPRFIPYHT